LLPADVSLPVVDDEELVSEDDDDAFESPDLLASPDFRA
jgi:hypothetical protein